MSATMNAMLLSWPADAEAEAEAASVAITRLTLIAIFALLIRVAWLIWHGTAESTWDGSEYARIAENLVSGHGYVGMRGTTMFVFPPLYPLAIAALLPLAGSAAQAGLNVSLLSGAAFVFPVFGIAALCYGRRAGYAAALVAAVLPFDVQLSTVVLADAFFLTLVTTGAFFLLRTANELRPLDAGACGVAFALAYLTRPEGLLLELLAIATLVMVFAFRLVSARRAAVLVLVTALPFAALAAPYVAFLSSHAGHVRVEGKSVLNLDIGLRMQRGMTYTQAADGIDEKLAEVGPELRQDYYFEPRDRERPSTFTVLAFGAANLVRHLPEIAHVVASRLCGSIALFLLAALGFAAGPWTRRRVLNQAILIGYGVTFLIALMSVFHFWDRYFVGFVPLLAIWAGNGLGVIAAALPRTRGRWVPQAPLVLTVTVLVALLFTMKTSFADDSRSTVEMQAGRWLAQHGGSGARILSISDQAPYYAGGVWFMLPDAPSDDAALRYVRLKRPDFIVLDDEYAAERPYVTAWLRSAIPDARAHTVYRSSDPNAPALEIVTWDHASPN